MPVRVLRVDMVTALLVTDLPAGMVVLQVVAVGVAVLRAAQVVSIPRKCSTRKTSTKMTS